MHLYNKLWTRIINSKLFKIWLYNLTTKLSILLKSIYYHFITITLIKTSRRNYIFRSTKIKLVSFFAHEEEVLNGSHRTFPFPLSWTWHGQWTQAKSSLANSRDSGYVLQRVEQNLRNIGSGKYIFSEFQLSAKADRVKQAWRSRDSVLLSSLYLLIPVAEHRLL